MNKIFVWAVVGLVVGNCTLRAQDASAIADSQASEERYQKFVAKLDELAEKCDVQQKRLDKLEADLRAAREEQAKVNPDTVSREELKALAIKLKELDEQRAADKERILKEIQRLAQMPVIAPVKPKTPVHVDTPPVDPNAKYEGYEYVVKSGDTLSKIVSAYRDQGVKVTLQQVLKHPLNAKLDPNKMLVGQKVFIPEVK
jgi:nucleoid-associated protein YgaU